MRKIFLLFATLLTTMACDDMSLAQKNISIENVALDYDSITLEMLNTKQLNVIIEPSDATNQNVIWTSSDESVATVDNGKVTAVKEGSANITATTEDGNKSATCKVTVMRDKSNDAIVFADEKMKKLCVQAYDTDGDGELSFKEAAATPSEFRGFRYEDRHEIQYFDEFKYFTGVKTIGSTAFISSNLSKITLPNSIKVISQHAFAECLSLSSINIPDSVKVIGPYAFEFCKALSSICIPDSVTKIQEQAFRSCENLISVELGKGIKTIDKMAFAYCESLPSIILPESITSIGEMAFNYCRSLSSITIPKSVKSIGILAFADCKDLQSINIPDSISVIGISTFAHCSDLISVELGKGIKTIDKMAFAYCESLPSIILPESVTSIGKEAFMSCDNIDIYIKSIRVPILGEEAFEPTAIIYVPNLSVKNYRAASGWSEYADQIVGYDYENNKVVE